MNKKSAHKKGRVVWLNVAKENIHACVFELRTVYKHIHIIIHVVYGKWMWKENDTELRYFQLKIQTEIVYDLKHMDFKERKLFKLIYKNTYNEKKKWAHSPVHTHWRETGY